jgi:phosphatidylethanolamine-binding protein
MHIELILVIATVFTAPSTQFEREIVTNPCQRRANSVVNHAFIQSGLVPDLVPIAPATRLRVIFGASNHSGGDELAVRLGNELTPAQTRVEPVRVEWDLTPLTTGPEQINPNQLYTLLMTDEDATRNASSPPRDPDAQEGHHWIVVNIPNTPIGGGNVSALGGDEWASYLGPGPPKGSGRHRYVFLLYSQPFGRLSTVDVELNDTDKVRFGWRTGEFIGRHRMGNPVAGNFFYSQFSG